MKLSDAYLEKTDTPMLELIVKVININLPVNHELLEKCRPLYEYSWFVQRIREYLSKEKNLDKAITQTIQDCEREGIMVDFVHRHGSEAVNMLFTQWNFEDALEVRYEEGMEDGFKDGEKKGKMITLIQLVLKKMKKGKLSLQIAEELEETPDVIDAICAAVRTCDTEDADIIYEKIKELK